MTFCWFYIAYINCVECFYIIMLVGLTNNLIIILINVGI